VPINGPNPHWQLPAIVDGKLQEFQSDRLKEELVIREPILKIVDFVLSAKDIIGSAVTADPHAALAWAGILLFLSVSIFNCNLLLFWLLIFPLIGVSESNHASKGCCRGYRIHFRSPCPVRSYRGHLSQKARISTY
jgi:N-terminal domain of NWD NACHT-NTPase